MQDISIRIYRPPEDIGLTLNVTEYTDYCFPKHFHNHYTVIFIEDGVNEGFTGKGKYKVGPGGLLIINPADLHAGNSFEKKLLRFHSLRIEQSFINEFLNENQIDRKGDLYFNTQPVYDKRLCGLMRKLIQKNGAIQQLNDEEIRTELIMFLLEHQSNQPIIMSATADHPSIRKAYQFIQDNYNNSFTIKELAQASHMSAYHLIRQFKRTFGLTPFQYLRNLRVEKAKLLLTKGQITGAANEVGFFDHSHFLKNYKKIEGSLPSQFSRTI